MARQLPAVANNDPPDETTMNRQKKLQQLFKAKAKKASAKLAPRSKDTYVSKADRLALAARPAEDSRVVPVSEPSE